MKWFSERKGLKKVRMEIQVNSMDEALRNRLWNLFYAYYLVKMQYASSITELPYLAMLLTSLWHDYFKHPIDTMPNQCHFLYDKIRDIFFKLEWFEVYDFLEFVVTHYPDESLPEQSSVLVNEKFKKECNRVLEEEMSAYRFVGNQIAQITSKEEISEIEEAMKSPVETVREHLKRALELMSNRKSPDYRNSIKESISAVEAICRMIAQDENATLGQALNKIEKQGRISLHPALKEAFSKLYGYTSDAGGIRHALLEKGVKPGFEDAKFMLVSCSAFINYLIAKSSKAGIDLEKKK